MMGPWISAIIAQTPRHSFVAGAHVALRHHHPLLVANQKLHTSQMSLTRQEHHANQNPRELLVANSSCPKVHLASLEVKV